MDMENSITGYTGYEHQLRGALLGLLGREKYEYFFDKVYLREAAPLSVLRTHTVLGVFLPRGRCQVIRVTRNELFPYSRQSFPWGTRF